MKDGMSYKTTSNLDIMERFIESGHECVILEWDRSSYVKPESLAGSINSSAKRYRKGVRAVWRRGNLYLFKKC